MSARPDDSLHAAFLRRTISSAFHACLKLEDEIRHDGDILSALMETLKYSEYAAVTSRRMCQRHNFSTASEAIKALPESGEVAVTEYGMTVTISRLLPARGKDSGYIRATIADLFRNRPRTFLRDVVVAVEQQYDKDLPPRKWRDHDNTELISLLNELSLWVLGGDDPQTMDLFQFATEGEQSRTVIHIVHRSKFPDWIVNVWGKNCKMENPDFTPSAPPASAAFSVGFASGHAPTEGSSATWN